MFFHVQNNPTEVQKSEMLTIYLGREDVSVFQHPYYPIKSNSLFFYATNTEDKIISYSIVQISRFSKLPFLKNAVLNYGVIANSKNEELGLFHYIIAYFDKNRYTSLTIHPFQNIISYSGVKQTIKPILTRKKDSIWIDLKLDLEQIKSGFSKMLIRNLKKAEKNKLDIRLLTSDTEINLFITILEKMSLHRGIGYDKSYVEEIIHFSKQFNCGYIIGCFSSEDQLLGGILVLVQGKTAEYFIAGTDPDFKSLPLSHLTMLKAIEYSKEQGFHFFDLGGIVLNADQNDQVYNITHFKKLFSQEYKIYDFPMIIAFSFWKNLIKTFYLKLAKV
jgi:hypothetical protein